MALNREAQRECYRFSLGFRLSLKAGREVYAPAFLAVNARRRRALPASVARRGVGLLAAPAKRAPGLCAVRSKDGCGSHGLTLARAPVTVPAGGVEGRQPQPGGTTAVSGKSKTVNVEKALSDLESLVESMEAGTLSLEQSLKHYERGVSLARACQSALQQAEQTVMALREGGESAPLAPFDPPGADTDGED